MMLARIQRDLYDFTDGEDPDDFGPLMNFWYRANSDALSAALTSHPGLKFIVDYPSIPALKNLCTKLFLLADTIVVRDPHVQREDDSELRHLIPTEDYQPGYWDDVISELQNLFPSPLTVSRPAPYWSSSTKTLNKGLECGYAVQMGGGIPKEMVEFIARNGRNSLETGRLVYAPFIPTMEMELELADKGVDLSAYFNTSPFYQDNYEWIRERELRALFKLNFPFLDGLDGQTMSKVKDDYRDEFESFSRLILSAIENVKSAIGTEQFSAELRHLQREVIDAGVSDVEKTFKKIEKIASLRKKGMLIGLLGLNAAAFFGAPPLALVSGLTVAGTKMVRDKVEELREKDDLRTANHYFLWRLGQEPR